jgi:hypothetical protein
MGAMRLSRHPIAPMGRSYPDKGVGWISSIQ